LQDVDGARPWNTGLRAYASTAAVGVDFQRALNSDLRRELGTRIKDVKMADSNRDLLIRLADSAEIAQGRYGWLIQVFA
jgi:hypothetical protein